MFFISSFLLVLALHSTIYRDMSLTAASSCILLGRPLIGIAVSWFIITNACGYNCKSMKLDFYYLLSAFVIQCLFFLFSAGLVSRFFSSKIFVRINKLTYAIYLLNPIIITCAFGTFDNGGTVDPSLYFILIIGISIVTYVFAIIFALLFEIPFYKLSNEILRGSTPVSKKLQ